MSSCVLGLSAWFHDAAAALIVDGQLIAFAQEERFSRRKNDPALPTRAIDFCLAEAGLTLADVDQVVWHEKPLLKFERVLLTSLRTFPRGLTTFRRAMVSMVGDKLWVKARLVERLGIEPGTVRFASHHQSHAAAAWRCSPFEEAAVLCVDGVGEWATTTTWRARGGAIEPLSELHFPHSLGLLYSVFTAFLGFRVNEGEYKVMGLAAFGEPRFEAEVRQVLRVQSDGSFTLDMDCFQYHRHPDKSWTDAFEALFGAPRAPGAPLEQRHKIWRRPSSRARGGPPRARPPPPRTDRGRPPLPRRRRCPQLRGCRAHPRRGSFADVFVMPAAGDAGSALGAALLGAGLPPVPLARAPGPGPRPDGVRAFLDGGGISYTEPADIAVAAAERIAAGQVVG